MTFPKIFALSAVLALGLGAGSAYADGDAAKGLKAFNKCKSCHTNDQGGKHKIGPNLFGVYGRMAGATDFGKYGEALAASGVTWDDDTLDKWLENPKEFLGGGKTKMSLKLKKEDDREDIIAYLKTLK